MSEADAALVGLVEALARLRPDDDPLDALLLAATHLGLTADSRSLAKNLDVAHAHALRALTSVEEAGLVTVTKRDVRTSRAHYALSEAGQALLDAAEAEAQAAS